MTRKRFIKKIMGLGYSRNEANALAARARRYGMSYAARWEHEKVVYCGRQFLAGFLAGVENVKHSPAVKKFAASVANCLAKVRLHLRITDVSLVPDGGYPVDREQWPKENPHLDGLRIHHSFVDELTESGPALTQEQIDATTAKWPGGTAVLVGIDLADGPDVAAQIHVAGGADNAD